MTWLDAPNVLSMDHMPPTVPTPCERHGDTQLDSAGHHPTQFYARCNGDEPGWPGLVEWHLSSYQCDSSSDLNMDDRCGVPGPPDGEQSHEVLAPSRSCWVRSLCHIPAFGDLLTYKVLVVGTTPRKNRHRVSNQQCRC